MNRLFFFCGLLCVVFAGLSSEAEVSGAASTSGSLKEILGNRKYEDSQILTDTKLRADEGSMSRYSMKFNLSYYGPTLNDLNVPDQPNPDGSIAPYQTAVGGSISARYRFSPTTALSMGTGIKTLHPFHGADRTDVNNPYLSYDVSSRLGALQMRNSYGTSAITVPNYTKVGEIGSLDFSNSLVYDLGLSGFAVALDSSVSYFLYNRGYQKSDGKSGRYIVGFYPSLKYNISDKLNVNSSLGINFWNPRQTDDQRILWNRILTQRLGLGYAYKKDVFFAPYLNFYPDRLALSYTTINMAAIFSLL